MSMIIVIHCRCWSDGSITEKTCIQTNNADPQKIIGTLWFVSFCMSPNSSEERVYSSEEQSSLSVYTLNISSLHCVWLSSVYSHYTQIDNYFGIVVGTLQSQKTIFKARQRTSDLGYLILGFFLSFFYCLCFTFKLNCVSPVWWQQSIPCWGHGWHQTQHHWPA